jgi:hypothetical protein
MPPNNCSRKEPEYSQDSLTRGPGELLTKGDLNTRKRDPSSCSRGLDKLLTGKSPDELLQREQLVAIIKRCPSGLLVTLTLGL